jgi:hypothetical protein
VASRDDFRRKKGSLQRRPLGPRLHLSKLNFGLGDFLERLRSMFEDSIAVKPPDRSPAGFPIQLVEFSNPARWAFRYLRRHTIFRADCTVPCPYCQSPVVCLQLVNASQLHLCDCVEDRDQPGRWTASIFDTHRCEVQL